MAERRFMQREHLEAFSRQTFGTTRSLVAFERLTGGSKKGVYRLRMDGDGSVIVYAWNASENYWSDNRTDLADPFAEGSGIDFLETAAAALLSAGARAPKLLLTDRSQSIYPADIAVVEDLRGGTLEALISADPEAAATPLRELGAMLDGMARYTSPTLGKPFAIASGAVRQERAERIALDRALDHLRIVASKVDALKQAHPRIEDKLHALYSRIQPRDFYGLIHGELGADHVMLDDHCRPVIIDIEGVMFFDIEWEHAFTRMRLGDAYEKLGVEVELDAARMDLYDLAQSLSLVEGPLRILETDFPNKPFMRMLVSIHTEKVLRLTMTP
jgi:hypothetical protein